jgi:hypothetical protein
MRQQSAEARNQVLVAKPITGRTTTESSYNIPRSFTCTWSGKYDSVTQLTTHLRGKVSEEKD